MWAPTTNIIQSANLKRCMQEQGFSDEQIKQFHEWSVEHYQDFWQMMLEHLTIQFKKSPTAICDLTRGIETPTWLPGAEMNIVDSCFHTNTSATAIIYRDAQNQIVKKTYGELHELVYRIANSLVDAGFKSGDAIAICMPMNYFAVAIYLGIVMMGGVVVSIADSFSSDEIATRLTIANAKAIFTQDTMTWAGKTIFLYDKIQQLQAPKAIVISDDPCHLHAGDIAWQDFLSSNTQFISTACEPMQPINILFSSGTTATPKAIPWNHTTAIKAASDAYLHQNIKPGDVLAWPTNLGWMMGPWLIFAALINHASIALFADAPKDRAFGEFVRDAHVTMLGVVPTLVATWRQSQCMENLDWNKIKIFSSTGECSNPDDMAYLMQLAGNKPVIEYCGGTEIGGAYVTSTVIERNYPSVCTTPAMGMNFILIDEAGKPTDIGEVAIIPPSIGLSTTLLNNDHHHVYFANMPTYQGIALRRHGDQLQQLENGYYIILGRADDAMNLGGIKISAAEIERALIGIADVIETAAIGVPQKNHGPEQLIIFAACAKQTLDKQALQREMQQHINTKLNPLFKIADVIIVKELPKTASNKIMRRVLRDSVKK